MMCVVACGIPALGGWKQEELDYKKSRGRRDGSGVKSICFLSEDPSSNPSTHMGLRIICKSNSSGLPEHQEHIWYEDICVGKILAEGEYRVRTT